MPSNFSANGVDLDDKFMARSGSAGGATNYSVGGTDLNNRYEPRGSTAKIGDVGYQTNGSDISNAFMEKHNCFTYQIEFDNSGEAFASWTTCYGTAGGAYDGSHLGDPGFSGTPAFTTGCVWSGTLSVISGQITAYYTAACS